jgi:diguanylate cyclase (GGDEF)-like protein/PAS domain S-box-containing protein
VRLCDRARHQLSTMQPLRAINSDVTWRTVVEHGGAVTLLISANGIVEYESPEFSRVTGLVPNATVGRPCFDVLRVAGDQGITAVIALMSAGKLMRATFEFTVDAQDGSPLVFLASLVSALHDGSVRALILTAHEITERKSVERQLRHNANHDSLTGLFNRRAAHRQLNRWIQETVGASKARPAVILLDIDGFKSVNDVYGHAIGDEMLIEIAQRLREVAPESVGVARLGGDELLLFARFFDVEAQVPPLVELVLSALRLPVLAETHWIFTSASIGVATFPEGGDSAEDLIRNADVALYQAKDSGRNIARWFSREAATEVRHRLALRRALSEALPNNELRVYFQPIFDVLSGQIKSHEALLRWQHPELGLLSASEFIGEIDGAGMTDALTDWMLIEVFDQSKLSARVFNAPIALNVHPRMFQRTGFAERILRRLQESNITPQRLELEITEDDFVRAADATPDNITALLEGGVKITIDDFGKGFSNFGYLTRFPIYAIKIDRSYVMQIGVSERTETLIGALVRLAEELGIQAIGEGVETQDQVDFLRDHGCTLQQGYLWGRPAPAVA